MEPTAPPSPDDSAERAPALKTIYVANEDGPDELTLVPTDVDETEITTSWITVEDDVMVDLLDWQ